MTTFNLSSDICEIISKPKYELLEWININAIELLKDNKNKINDNWFLQILQYLKKYMKMIEIILT